MDTTQPQAFIFLITLYGGMLTALTYEIYRYIRKAAKCGRFITALIDTLFILTLGVIVTAVLYTANFGELRLYTFVGFALGFSLYMSGLSPFVAYLSRKIKKRFSSRNNKG